MPRQLLLLGSEYACLVFCWVQTNDLSFAFDLIVGNPAFSLQWTPECTRRASSLKEMKENEYGLLNASYHLMRVNH